MNTSATSAPQTIKPWYKERWTWMLMVMPATAVVAGSVSMWLAVSSFDGLVADDYYKQGLAINQTLARSAAAQVEGLKAEVNFTADRVSIQLNARDGVKLPDTVVFTLAHPTKAGLDQKITLAGQGGHYEAKLLAPPGSARWKILIEDESRSWRLNGTAFLPTETQVRLDAADLKPVD